MNVSSTVGVPMRVVFYFLSFWAIRGWLACIPRKRVPLRARAFYLARARAARASPPAAE